MNGPNTKINTKEIEIIPAVLAKTKELLLDYINRVSPYVSSIHIDVMDNKFVPNLTIGLDEIKLMPRNLKYEFHWMVENPEKWIANVNGSHMHIIHIETIKENWEEIKRLVGKTRSKLGIAINPETSVERLLPYINDIDEILVMSVHPGFSGQKYIKEVEEKVLFLRSKFPELIIEIDGGINSETAKSAVKAGVNRLAVASAIFKYENVKEAIEKLKSSLSEAYAH